MTLRDLDDLPQVTPPPQAGEPLMPDTQNGRGSKSRVPMGRLTLFWHDKGIAVFVLHAPY